MLQTLILTTALLGQCDNSLFVRGDSNCDGAINLTDVIFIVNYLNLGGPAPQRLDAADTNDDRRVDISDVLFLAHFLTLGGIPPDCPFPKADKDCVWQGDELDLCHSMPTIDAPPTEPIENGRWLGIAPNEIIQDKCRRRDQWINSSETFDNEVTVITASDGNNCGSQNLCGEWSVFYYVWDGIFFTKARLKNEIQDVVFGGRGEFSFIVQFTCPCLPSSGDRTQFCCPNSNQIVVNVSTTQFILKFGPVKEWGPTKEIGVYFEKNGLVQICGYRQDEGFGECIFDKQPECDKIHKVKTPEDQLLVTQRILEEMGDAPECEEWRLYEIEINNVFLEFELGKRNIDIAEVNSIQLKLVPDLHYIFHGCDGSKIIVAE